MAGNPEDYLVVGDKNKPSTWHLPVKRNGKPNRSLAAAAWAALHSNYRGNPYGGPGKEAAIRKLNALYRAQGWEMPTASTSNDPPHRAEGDSTVADFTAFDVSTLSLDRSQVEFTGEEGYVIRRGKIFEAGDYPDKKFTITPEEMAEAINDFEPCDVDSEHRPSIFDGKLGELIHVEVGDQPADLQGWLKIPKWLDDVVGDTELKVSTTWSRETPKRIQKLALTVDPRVPDATMLSAFSASTGEPETRPLPDGKETKRMSLMDKIKASLSGVTPEELAEFTEGGTTPPATPPTPPTPPAATPPDHSAEFARIQQLETQLAEMAADKRRTEATAFVDGLIKDRRLLPALRVSQIAELTRAMEDDAADKSEVTFAKADGTSVKMSRTELKKANLAGLPQHDLFTDHALTSLPKDSVLLHAGGEEEKSEFSIGYEYGKKYVEENYPKNGNGK